MGERSAGLFILFRQIALCGRRDEAIGCGHQSVPVVSGRERKGEAMVLCGSNGYERKYYFNEAFSNLPEAVQKELQVLCVWFTEECGGILTMEFDEGGRLEFKHTTSEYDGYYDEIGADLKIKQYREQQRELLEKLELYYQALYLLKNAGQDIAGEGTTG